jgi:hypothetical protein
MPYDVPFSQLSRNAQAILNALGTPYTVRDNEISQNTKAILDGIAAFKIDTVTDAPKDGKMYARIDGNWQVVDAGGTVLDAPSDGQAYMRMNEAWTPLTYQARAPDYDSGNLPVPGPGESVLITHNLGITLEFLNVKVMLHRPADNAWIDVGTIKDGAGALQEGLIVGNEYASPNGIRLEVGPNGLALLGGGGGWIFPVDLIRVLIWKNTDRVVVAPAGNDEDIHIFANPLDHLYDYQIGWYYASDGKKKPIYKAVVNIPQYSTTIGATVNTQIIQTGIIDTLIDATGILMHISSTDYYVIPMSSSNTSGVAHTVNIMLISTGSLIVRDIYPSSYALNSSYKGTVTVKFTALKDTWI